MGIDLGTLACIERHGKGLDLPSGIHRDVTVDQSRLEVELLGAVLIFVPPGEVITLARGVGRRRIGKRTVRHVLGIDLGALARIEGKRIGVSSPLGIDVSVGRDRLTTETVWLGQRRVAVPPLEGIARLLGIVGLLHTRTVDDLLGVVLDLGLVIPEPDVKRFVIPVCLERQIRRQLSALFEFVFIRIEPSREDVIGVRHARKIRDLSALLDDTGLLLIGAVVKDERHCVGLDPLGI